jgi:hypothetical protein
MREMEKQNSVTEENNNTLIEAELNSTLIIPELWLKLLTAILLLIPITIVVIYTIFLIQSYRRIPISYEDSIFNVFKISHDLQSFDYYCLKIIGYSLLSIPPFIQVFSRILFKKLNLIVFIVAGILLLSSLIIFFLYSDFNPNLWQYIREVLSVITALICCFSIAIMKQQKIYNACITMLLILSFIDLLIS